MIDSCLASGLQLEVSAVLCPARDIYSTPHLYQDLESDVTRMALQWACQATPESSAPVLDEFDLSIQPRLYQDSEFDKHIPGWHFSGMPGLPRVSVLCARQAK
jgi:hypothetical protein